MLRLNCGFTPQFTGEDARFLEKCFLEKYFLETCFLAANVFNTLSF